jgi:hypothetical protein
MLPIKAKCHNSYFSQKTLASLAAGGVVCNLTCAACGAHVSAHKPGTAWIPYDHERAAGRKHE